MKKEIEEMVKIMPLNSIEECKGSCEECKYNDEKIPCLTVIQAERLYNAGYRKIDQTHKQLQEENVQMPVAKDLSTLLLAEAEYYCDSEGHIDSEKFAEVLVENGYHKTIWHKVADGDLPKECTEIYCCYNCPIGLAYDICSYFTDYGEETPHFYYYDSEEGWIRQDDVIAWTELPKYQGEEQ